jgi:hypothetical protein
MEGLVAGVAGLVGLISPDAGVAAAFTTPAAVAGAKNALSRFYNQQQARQASVLRFAAQQAGIEPEGLERRCEEDSRLDELLQVVMAASADTAMRKKLVAYALALADGVKSSGEPSYWQSALVNAMRDLDHQHLALLERLTWTRARLGLDFANDEVAPYLDAGQVEQIGAHIAPLSSVLAVLLGHGLLEQEFVGGGMAFRGTSRGLWRIDAVWRSGARTSAGSRRAVEDVRGTVLDRKKNRDSSWSARLPWAPTGEPASARLRMTTV